MQKACRHCWSQKCYDASLAGSINRFQSARVMIHAILQTENVVVFLRKAQIGVGLLILCRLTKLGPQRVQIAG